MLLEFLKTHRVELIARCRAKAARRTSPHPPAVLDFGIPQFLGQLIETFRLEQTPEALARHQAAGPGHPSLALVPSDISGTATKHGHEMRRQGLTIDQVVHNYGDLCQALTELALEKDAPISVDEFHTFNRCLDDAIADAVTAYAQELGQPIQAPHELGDLIETAIHSFAAIQSGTVGVNGATARVHELALARLREILRDEPGLRAIISPAAPR